MTSLNDVWANAFLEWAARLSFEIMGYFDYNIIAEASQYTARGLNVNKNEDAVKTSYLRPRIFKLFELDSGGVAP